MTGRARHGIGAMVAVLLALALSACSSGGDPAAVPDSTSGTSSTSSPSATPSTTPSVELPKPPVRGACYQLDHAAALAPTVTAATVACTKKHTAQTYFVGRLELVADGHLLTVDSDRAEAQVATACRDRFADHVGGDPRLSVLNPVWFTATVEQSDAGADWFRCDVVALGGSDTLAPLPPKTKKLLDSSEGRARFGLCSDASPTTRGTQQVPCADPHQWRAILAVDLPGPGYPTQVRASDVMRTPCADAARDVAADQLNVKWSEARPTKAQWKAGRRYGLCWVPA